MLRIRAELVDAMVAHARADHPDEACGVIAGPEGSDRPERFIPMINAARSATFYEFDSADLLRLYREMDDRGEEPVVIYHSHTATEAYPSRTDISYASEPGAHGIEDLLRDLCCRDLAAAHRLVAHGLANQLALRGLGRRHVGRTVAVALADAGGHKVRTQHTGADLVADQF